MGKDIIVPFCYRKRGYFYFNRRIPSDLIHHYGSAKVCYSLKTKSVRVAMTRALTAASHLDEYWLKLRMQNDQVPLQHLTVSDPARDMITKTSLVDLGPKLSEAMEIYIKLKGHNRPKTFTVSTKRACRYLIKARGNKRLADFTKADATAFRDSLIDRGLNGSSVSRVFGTVRSIITFAANESGLTMINPFLGVFLDSGVGVFVRQPISAEDIRIVQDACFKRDDDMRWLVALVADTGLRLAEAAGLHIDDFHLTEIDIPFVRIQPHPWRRLKTKGSERIVPLAGSSLWAAQRIIQNVNDSKYAFPRYNLSPTTNAGSASAGLNKWLKQYISNHGTMHCFRHALRDRLRNVECPSEIIDQIGGWSPASVGQGYGEGFALQILNQWLKKATDPAP